MSGWSKGTDEEGKYQGMNWDVGYVYLEEIINGTFFDLWWMVRITYGVFWVLLKVCLKVSLGDLIFFKFLFWNTFRNSEFLRIFLNIKSSEVMEAPCSRKISFWFFATLQNNAKLHHNWPIIIFVVFEMLMVRNEFELSGIDKGNEKLWGKDFSYYLLREFKIFNWSIFSFPSNSLSFVVIFSKVTEGNFTILHFHLISRIEFTCRISRFRQVNPILK